MSDLKKSDAEWLNYRTFSLLLAAALLAAFPGITLGFQTLFYRDFGALGYPGIFFTRASLWHGQFPLWNPYSHCGVPWLAQMGQWYPPFWIYYLLPLPWAVNFMVVAHLWLAGVGLFWLLRCWHIGTYPAALAAFAFVFNGVTLSCLQWGNYIAALAWLPWVVASVIRAWYGNRRQLAFAAVASAMQVLTATPELTLLTWLFLGVLWLCDVLSRNVAFMASASRIFLVVLLAAGISMIQMLPFFDLLAHSQRHAGDAEAGAWSMPAWGLANLIVPLFHCYQSPQGTWFQHGQDFLQSYYLGTGVLALAVTGVIATRNRTTMAVAAFILFCWLAAMGTNGFLYGPIKQIFPLISIARFPVKMTILTAFLVPLLAARGMEQIQYSGAKPPRRILFVVTGCIGCAMLVILFMAKHSPLFGDNWNTTAVNTLYRAVLMVALVAGILILAMVKARGARIALQLMTLAAVSLDAVTHCPNLAPTLPVSILAPGFWQAAGKPPLAPGVGRIMTSPDAEQKLLYSPVADMKADLIGKRIAEWYNLNLLDGLPKVNGAVTLRPADFDILESYLYFTRGGHCGPGLVDFLSVAWLSSPDNPTMWIARTNFLPWITAGQKPIFAGDDKTLQAITADDFAPDKIVYLSASVRPLVTVANGTPCMVTNAAIALNKVVADIEASAPGIVVLSQSYYHLWQAFVDGRRVQLLRANLAFQAVEVPAGKHRVEWIYRDPYLEIGACITAVSLVLCVLIYRRRDSGGRPCPFAV